MISIFAIDPGPSTGVAWGIFNERAPTAVEAVRLGIEKKSATITGDELAQARAIFSLWQSWKEYTVRRALLEPDQIRLVIEDFVLYPGAHAGGKEGIAPARIAWAFEGYRAARGDKFSKEKHVSPAIWQTSSVGMRNKGLLRKADCWVKGREHERSAYCHILARMRKEMR